MEIDLLIGIDDTDGPESRGTGFLSREMGELIRTNGLGQVKTISRHFLYPYSSDPFSAENSAICLLVSTPDRDTLTQFCAEYLPDESQASASPGLCIISWDRASERLSKWATECKKKRIGIDEAGALAVKEGIFLKGWRGGDGQVGAMAAVGLRRSGNDGRFIWMERLRELAGAYSAEDLMALTAVDLIIDTKGERIDPEDLIEVGEWVRPVIIDHEITIIVQENKEGPDECPWVATSKAYIYNISK